MFDPNVHHRRSIRMKHYDYRQAGAYFVTVCTRGRECLFGEVITEDGLNRVELNEIGRGFSNAWLKTPRRHCGLELDEWIIMPNHLHAIVSWPLDSDWRLGDVIGGYKSLTTTAYCKRVHIGEWPPFEKKFWQRNFWEHVIRNERELENIRAYIVNNPANWTRDIHHPRLLDKSETPPTLWNEM